MLEPWKNWHFPLLASLEKLKMKRWSSFDIECKNQWAIFTPFICFTGPFFRKNHRRKAGNGPFDPSKQGRRTFLYSAMKELVCNGNFGQERL